MTRDIIHKDIKEINGLFLSTDIFGTKALIKKSNDTQQVLLADIITIEETKNDFYFCKISENKTESFAILTKDGRILKADLANSEIQVDQLLEHEKQITKDLINTSSKTSISTENTSNSTQTTNNSQINNNNNNTNTTEIQNSTNFINEDKVVNDEYKKL